MGGISEKGHKIWEWQYNNEKEILSYQRGCYAYLQARGRKKQTDKKI